MHFACIRCGSAACEREDGSAHGQRGRTFTALAVRQSISKHLSRSWPSDFFFLGPVLSPEVSERKARTVSLRVHSVTGKNTQHATSWTADEASCGPAREAHLFGYQAHTHIVWSSSQRHHAWVWVSERAAASKPAALLQRFCAIPTQKL